MQISGAQRFGYSAPRSMSGCAKKWVLRRQGFKLAPRIVDGSIVDDDDLIVPGAARKCCRSLLHEQRKIFRFVLRRHEYAHDWTSDAHVGSRCAVRRGSIGAKRRHTLFRILAERTP